MDEDRMLRIGLILAKTSELRSNIINTMQKSSNPVKEAKDSESKESKASPDAKNQEDDSEEEAESLLSIKDALESIEGQLSSLQALHHQQWYEKESTLAEIEYNQRKLLKELKAYKGKDSEVIKEVIAFVSEPEDNDIDLPLPPYPTWSFTQNQRTIGLKNLHWTSKEGQKSRPFRLVKDFFVAAAKTALTVIGLITIMNLAGYEVKLRKRDDRLKLANLFEVQDDKGRRVECAPGKVLVIENGEVRCVVKERVEVPFESVVDTPDVGYGCG